MKKMHICFYAFFQFVSAQSESMTLPVTEPVTVTESVNDCTRDDWGYCDCDDDEYREGLRIELLLVQSECYTQFCASKRSVERV